jgi:hypothetical protein
LPKLWEHNPLSYTDPSGYFLSGLFKEFSNFFRAAFAPRFNPAPLSNDLCPS